jgi:hypothetical protein
VHLDFFGYHQAVRKGREDKLTSQEGSSVMLYIYLVYDPYLIDIIE